MTSTTVASAEWIAIGAADLKANAQRLFRIALVVSAAIHLSLIGIYLGATLRKPADEATYMGRVIRMTTLPPPPPISNAPPPPVIPIAQPIAKPTIGMPVPVPDAQAPDQTIMDQAQLAALNTPVGIPGSRDTLIITSADEFPAEGEFVYYEDEPVPVSTVKLRYSDFARDAGIEGKVVLHVLVGKDGRVRNVRVIKSVIGLDQPAVDAVKQWVFKPALSNNKPVAVWVEVPVEFHF